MHGKYHVTVSRLQDRKDDFIVGIKTMFSVYHIIPAINERNLYPQRERENNALPVGVCLMGPEPVQCLLERSVERNLLR